MQFTQTRDTKEWNERANPWKTSSQIEKRELIPIKIIRRSEYKFERHYSGKTFRNEKQFKVALSKYELYIYDE